AAAHRRLRIETVARRGPPAETVAQSAPQRRPRPCRALDPALRDELSTVSAPAIQDELAEPRHVPRGRADARTSRRDTVESAPPCDVLQARRDEEMSPRILGRGHAGRVRDNG